MPHHVIIDGSNLATEGRTAPSLKQLNEAIDAYRSDFPTTLITVVVDATFGHRIDPKEVAEFERAIETNAFVAPPAGAVGRGDGFILSIANKAKATVLSNDSYQEFHGEYAWLFEEGRLVGGKPVPHVGWVFVYRTPVRGPVSRRSVKEQKVVDKSPRRRSPATNLTDLPAISANAPMPVPKSAPPGAVMPAPKPVAPKTVNDLMAFLSFVEHHPVGTSVEAVVDSYSSHGAYVLIGEAHGYVPLRLMGDPAPRSARDAMTLGDAVTLVVSSFDAKRRSIDLSVLSMAPDAKPAEPKKAAKKATAKAEKPAKADKPAKDAKPTKAAQEAKPEVAKKAAAKNATAKAPAAKKPAANKVPAAPVVVEVAVVQAPPAKKGAAKKVAAKPADAKPVAKKAAAPTKAAAKPTKPAKPAKA
ncbi:MAG: S1 RNA-binding domain-containing protein [Actinobacteria bacterium]|nr:S1 RNA-binding domain-containing protein [Actinomycetota bacterium]